MASAIHTKLGNIVAEVMQDERAANETLVQSHDAPRPVEAAVCESPQKTENTPATKTEATDNSSLESNYVDKKIDEANKPQDSQVNPSEITGELVVKRVETSPTLEGSPKNSICENDSKNPEIQSVANASPMPIVVTTDPSLVTESSTMEEGPKMSLIERNREHIEPRTPSANENENTMENHEGDEDQLPVYKMHRLPTLRGKKPYKCPYDPSSCQLKYCDKSHLYRHIQKSHKVRIIFVDKDGKEEVATNKSISRTAKAANCSSSSSAASLRKHRPQSAIKGERKFPCDFPNCHWVFTRSNHIRRHQLRAHPGYKSASDDSGAATGQPKVVVDAKQGVKPHSCDEKSCNQRFKTVAAMKKHKRLVHESLKSLSQPDEDQPVEGRSLRSSSGSKLLSLFSSKVDAKNAENVDITEVKPSFACEITSCDFKCARKDQLSKHIEEMHKVPVMTVAKVEEDESANLLEESPSAKKLRRPFVCDYESCAKSYTKYAQLIKHKTQAHVYERVPRKNKFDGETATAVSNQHAPPKNPLERPYVCNYENCDWSFKRSYHLERHLECHQRKSKINLSVCVVPSPSALMLSPVDEGERGKSSEWQSRLRQNKPPVIKYVETIALAIEKEKYQSGSDEEKRGFSCDFPRCGKRFKKKSSLDQHRAVHIPSKATKPVKSITDGGSVSSYSTNNEVGSGKSSVINYNTTYDRFSTANHREDQLKKSTPPKKRPYEEENNNDSTEVEEGYEGEGEENPHVFDKRRQRKRKKKKEKGAYVCDVEGCEKKFSRNCELTRHKLNHMDVWPFTCDQPGCGRKFKRKDIYRNHQKTHNKLLEITDGKAPREKPKSKTRKRVSKGSDSCITATVDVQQEPTSPTPPSSTSSITPATTTTVAAIVPLPPPLVPATSTTTQAFTFPSSTSNHWNSSLSWPEQKLATSTMPPSAPVSISIINVCLPPQTAPSETLTPAGILAHSFPRTVSHQMQHQHHSLSQPPPHHHQMHAWTTAPPQSGRPTVVQQNWGHPLGLSLGPHPSGPLPSSNWQASVSRPSVVQATWSNLGRQPEPQNHIVPRPAVLETLGLRPNLPGTQLFYIPNNSQETNIGNNGSAGGGIGSNGQCRYNPGPTNSTTVVQMGSHHLDHREGWTL